MSKSSAKTTALYANYVKRFSCDDGKDIQTKKDKQFDACLHLREDSDRLTDVTVMLRTCVDVLCDSNAYKKDKAQCRDIVLYTIIPALGHMSSHMLQAAKELAPIPSTEYAHQRESTQQKNNAKAAALKRNTSIQTIMLEDYVEASENADSSPTTNAVTPPKKASLPRAAKAKNKQLPLTINPPAPKNGNVYGKTEFCEIVTQFRKRSAQRRAMIEKIIEMGFVTNHIKSLYRLINHYESFKDGQTFINDEMRGRGAPPILSDEDLTKSIALLNEQNGKVMNDDNVSGMMKQVLVESKRRKIDDAGYYAGGEHINVTRQTVTNYVAMSAAKPGVHIAKSTINKTTARYASENSFRCVFTSLTLVLCTHFVEIPEEDVNIRRLAKTLSPADSLLYELASICRGGRAVRPIPATNLANNDDKVFYARPGANEGGGETIVLCSSSSLKKRGHSSLYNAKDENKMDGIRTKVHAMVNGAAESAAQCITFGGFSERELPDDDMVVLEIEGLCIGGATSNKIGYVILLRKSPGAELKRYNFIARNVHQPFLVDKCKSKQYPECPTVAYCDGDPSQLKGVTDPNTMKFYEENNTTFNKHNASATAIEQSLDKSGVFPTFDEEFGKLTDEDLPSHDNVLKMRMDEAFAANRNRVRISSTKRNTMTNVVCVYPAVATTAFTRKKIQRGFFENGHLDRKHKLFPVMDQILATCRTMIPKEMLGRFMDNIQRIFDTMQEKGYIPEELWDEIDIPKDEAPDGSVYERNANISQENQTRARILTHPALKNSRKKRREEIDEAVRQKKLQAEKKLRDRKNADAATTNTLLQSLKKRDETAEPNLSNCTKHDFSNVTAPDLREFIFQRSGKYKTKSELSKVKKGKLEDAIQEPEGGSDNMLISIAYELRCVKSKLEESNNSPEEAADNTSESAADEVLVIPVMIDPAAEWKSAAEILSKPSWIGNVNSVFNPGNRLTMIDSVDDEVQSRVTSLSRSILRRFEYAVKQQVVESQQSHPILKWYRRNLPAFTAHIVLFQHSKRNTSNLSDMDCLLTNSMNKFLLLNSNTENLEGAYLAYDYKEEKFVRSGKCTGRGMVERWKEHRQCASSDTNSNDSKFYDIYPSSTSARASDVNGRRFEDLHQYAAAAFEPTEATSKLFREDFDSGGLFCWSEEEKDVVRRTNMRGCNNDGAKFNATVGYAMEETYRLAISRRDNISESFAFEAFGFFSS